MKNYHIIGAFDRHNYGDILFALIHSEFIKEVFGEEVGLDYYSISSSDLTKCGGKKTRCIAELLRKEKSFDDVLILAGGEILAVDWVNMVSNLLDPLFGKFLQGTKKIFGYGLANSILIKAISAHGKFPYVLDPDLFGKNIFYTSVGGTSINKLPDSVKSHIKSFLVGIGNISVRDKLTMNNLEEFGVFSDLAPDSASLMAEFFNKDFLSERYFFKNVDFSNGFNIDKYYCFQTNRYYGGTCVDEIVREIEIVYRKTGFSVMFVPIGYASGHEDNFFLNKVYKLVESKNIPCGLLISPHVFDIMAAIAFSMGYAGTSLHGAITSYVFKNKVCGLSSSRVKKLKNYIDCWMPKEIASHTDSFRFSDILISLFDSDFNGLDEIICRQNLLLRTSLLKYCV